MADFFSRNFGQDETVDSNNKFLLCKLMCLSIENRVMRNPSINNGINPYIRFNHGLISELRKLRELQRDGIEIGELINKLSSRAVIKEESDVLYISNNRGD